MASYNNKNKESWTSATHEYRVRIEQDSDYSNPREEHDNAGMMACRHSRYNLGDLKPKLINGAFLSSKEALHARILHADSDRFFEILAEDVVSDKYPEALLLANAEKIARKHFIILPLYLYDHSGITMSTGAFSCPWDSGQVGWIYFPKAKLKDESWTEEEATKYLEGEVETYDQYLTGDVWGYIIERLPLPAEDEEYEESDWKNAEEVESCWGFYGEVYEGAYDPQYHIDKDLKELNKDEQKEIDTFAAHLVAC